LILGENTRLPNHAVQPPPGGILIPAGTKPWNDKEHYLLRRDQTTIGRGSDCDIRINHPTVSRVHAALTWTDGELVLAHLSPVNPTLVNGVPVGEKCPLESGDVIEIADGIALRLELFGGNEDVATEPRGRNIRRIYAILCADVAEYARLVEDDDIATARQLENCIAIIRQHTERADGRVSNVAGDGVLSMFTSTESAVSCAIGMQRSILSLNKSLPPGRRMEFRVGINSGDVLITPAGNIHGDAINIAARVQTFASPGGILVTGVVHDQLQRHEEFRFEYVCTNELKNLSRDVRIYLLHF
jgi:class 3 adenylate cyclase